MSGTTRVKRAGAPAEGAGGTGTRPFWRTTQLSAMTPAEWESLCDGCGRCCLIKLEDEDTAEIWFTDVACRLLDAGTCRCTDYANRAERVPGCVSLDANTVARLAWLPPTCAYRLVAEGRDLYWWHPLVSGDPDTVHLAGISVRGRVLGEEEVAEADLEDRIVEWPGEGGIQTTSTKSP
jgi:uncharacterized cysteine cluster protein YcgN (CxxCxxCC family)